MAYLLIAVALIQIVVGSSIYLRSPKDIVRVNEIAQTHSTKIQSEEIPRMHVVMKNFTIYHWVEIILLLAGIIMILFFSPIYIIRKGQNQIEEIKATKKAIGGLTDDNQYFDTHELQLQQGDTFYISTDGYADQYSGHDKKLTTKKFKNILLDMQDKSMQEQEIYLDAFIEDWKKGIEQIDDILVIGVRL
jgi:flagellar biosynthesis/type III secretory pathway M-ring protein FliF/YscJ